MSWIVRSGEFDLVIAAGDTIHQFPSIGVKTLSSICSEAGLTVGWFGGLGLKARGVIPLPGTGGIVIAEDSQHRIHRVRARAIVRMIPENPFPDPFPGCWAEGLIPIQTAERLYSESIVSWSPAVAIIGTGNRALRFGTRLLETERSKHVTCVEPHAQWSGKRFSGWEVERRRFESLGGKIIEGQLTDLTQKDPLTWEFRVRDRLGVRVLHVARVVSAGPFTDISDFREYPPGSGLHELVQTAPELRILDIDAWKREEESSRLLGARIVRSLIVDLGEMRESIDRTLKRAKIRLKRLETHRENPFTPTYRGKWMDDPDSNRLKSFSGVPKSAHLHRTVASIECVENIACDICQESCPESAIKIQRYPSKASGEGPTFLIEDQCTGCGACLTACPSRVPVLLQERQDQSLSKLVLPWYGPREWKVGEFAQAVNRRGEPLASVRVSGVKEQLVEVDIPTHLLWEARGLIQSKPQILEDPDPKFEDRVEITIDGDRRFVRENLAISVVLFEIGRARPADSLMCPDGSCGLCTLQIDGTKKLACQTKARRGMALKLEPDLMTPSSDGRTLLCPCLGIHSSEITNRIEQGQLSSPEAVASITGAGRGKCRGLRCAEPLRRLLEVEGLDASRWIDWRFPSMDWILGGKLPSEGSRSP